ncbi:hypothetical protein C8Q74DRAFT_1295350 [Fomes fomentarius]|nr:hypothetical protein C8Q74DRAFT_1295350 [Fomes fomentarius]
MCSTSCASDMLQSREVFCRSRLLRNRDGIRVAPHCVFDRCAIVRHFLHHNGRIHCKYPWRESLGSLSMRRIRISSMLIIRMAVNFTLFWIRDEDSCKRPAYQLPRGVRNSPRLSSLPIERRTLIHILRFPPRAIELLTCSGLSSKGFATTAAIQFLSAIATLILVTHIRMENRPLTSASGFRLSEHTNGRFTNVHNSVLPS